MDDDHETNRRGTLFSETDIYGKIIFANDNFCDISQFKWTELAGQPHNIVRHPDMPGKLFELLWEAIERGGVFRGIIKNKAKDGSHYWVRATIMPVYDYQSKITKYIGGTHHIGNDKVAEELYEEQTKRLQL